MFNPWNFENLVKIVGKNPFLILIGFFLEFQVMEWDSWNYRF